jgi:L-alanine-DL-glutamate epimerase-like enolase superfamily enzyme
MQISRIDAFPLRYPEPNDDGNTRFITLARVESDDGLVGWGEAVTMWPEAGRAVKLLVEEGLAPLLRGRDPRDTVALWEAMRAHTWWYGDGGIATFAVSAVDMALWDLKGKAHGLPLHAMLGGKLRDRLRVCVSTHPSKASIEEMAGDFAAVAAQGVTAVKFGFGKRGAAHLGYDPARDLAFVRAVREAVGPAVDVIVDLGQNVRYEPMQAIRMVRAFEQQQIRWIEDPLPRWDWEGYRQLRAAVATPIATGEELWTVEQYRRLIEAGFADVILVDAGRAEGVTGYWKVQELAALHGRTVNAHAWSSAVLTAASAHLTAVAPRYAIFELKALPNPMQHELVREPLDHVDGWLSVPEGPGLGVEVDEAVVQKYLDRGP